VWQPLRTGIVIKSGTIIQTAAEKGSYVDLVWVKARRSTPSAHRSDTRSYTPSADQNIVRLYENTILQVDKLTSMETGADTVTETQLDLQRGRIFGNVKKMSAASKYEVKLPNGVAGIRGTIYTLSAEGVVQVLVGSASSRMLAGWHRSHTGRHGGQQFMARTGQITAIPNYNQGEMVRLARKCVSAQYGRQPPTG